MCNFAEDIEKEAGAPIEAVVIGHNIYFDDETRPIPTHQLDVVLTWAEARPLLDYEYEDGYGLPDCHAITAWTSERVVFVSQYDGATNVESVPRNPVAHEPITPGSS